MFPRLFSKWGIQSRCVPILPHLLEHAGEIKDFEWSSDFIALLLKEMDKISSVQCRNIADSFPVDSNGVSKWAATQRQGAIYRSGYISNTIFRAFGPLDDLIFSALPFLPTTLRPMLLIRVQNPGDATPAHIDRVGHGEVVFGCTIQTCPGGCLIFYDKPDHEVSVCDRPGKWWGFMGKLRYSFWHYTNPVPPGHTRISITLRPHTTWKKAETQQ